MYFSSVVGLGADVLELELDLLLDRLHRSGQQPVQAAAARAPRGVKASPLFVAGFLSSQIPRLRVRIVSGPRTPGSSASSVMGAEYVREGWDLQVVRRPPIRGDGGALLRRNDRARGQRSPRRAAAALVCIAGGDVATVHPDRSSPWRGREWLRLRTVGRLGRSRWCRSRRRKGSASSAVTMRADGWD